MKRILLATALAGMIAIPAAVAEQTSGAGIQSPEHVRDVQQALSQKGFNPGEIDGVWGNRTISAVREFQKQQGLDATGSLNPQTTSALGIDENAGRVSDEPSSRFDSTDTEASGSGSPSER